MNEDEDEKVVKLNDIEKDELFSYKKKNYLKNIIIIILVILVIGLGVFVIFLLKGKKDNENNEDNKDNKDDEDSEDDEDIEKGCKPGYFIPDDLTKKKCVACSESNCVTCKGTKSNNICLICAKDYYLANYKCKPYSFMVTYNNDKINQKLQLINNDYLPYITGMYMDNSEISIASSYEFSSIQYYGIYFYMNISSIHSLSHMFDSIKQIVSIYFTSKFDTKNINNMDYMFYSCSVVTLDVSSFNTSKVTRNTWLFFN